MKTILLLFFMALSFEQHKPTTLEDLRWKNRVILIFSQDFDYAKSAELINEIGDRKLIYFVFGDSIISNSNYHFTDSYRDNLLKKHNPSSKDVKWILIGLDGGVKLQEESELSWDKVFKTIDSMPMRQSEISNKLNQQ